MAIFSNKSKQTDASSLDKSAFKAGLWYTISNFILRSMGFLTVPIFSRVMTASDYGSYSNFTACLSIMLVLTGFDAYTSIIRSKYEVQDDLDSYILSVLAVNTSATLLFYGLFLLFPNFFCILFQVNEACIHYMFVYLLVIPAFNLVSTKQRAFYKYKMFVFLTAVVTVGSVIASLAFVFLSEDSLTARIFGQYAPGIVVGLFLYIYIIIKGRKIHWKYCKYVIALCLPLLPHLISIYALSTSNRIIITILCGSDKTAYYAIASSATHVVSALFDSANKAWAPWLLDNLHSSKLSEIKSKSNVYFAALILIAAITIALGPEIVYILGGENLYESRFLLPPLVLGCAFQIVYTMYVNVEFFLKQTKLTAIATTVAALCSVCLSIVLTSVFGFQAAPYATAIGYGILLVAHYCCVYKLGYKDVFDTKKIFFILVGFAIYSIFSQFFYQNRFLRIVVIVFLLVLCAVLFKKYGSQLLSLKK